MKKILESPAAGYARAFLKWVLLAGVVGLICGCVGVALHYCVDLVTELRLAHRWVLFLLPVGGAAIIGLYHLLRLPCGAGTNMVIESIRTDGTVPISMAILMFFSTIITHFVGGSAGREGAALQIGGSIGNRFGRALHLPEKDLHLITLCGMSAVFSALFGTPLTAAVFVLEVISVGEMYYAGLVPCLLSALMGFGLAQVAGIPPTQFAIAAVPEPAVLPLLQAAAVAAAAALLSIGFCVLLHKTEHAAEKLLKNEYLRIIAGGALLIVLSLLTGGQRYNGAGMDVIRAAIAGAAGWEDFLLKMLFTAVTIGCGFKGGEIVPTFFAGACFGCVAGPLIGLDAGFAAAIGLIALFCGMVNCPVASILLSIELFGAQGMLYFAVAASVSYLLSGYYGLYSSQKIIYSKLAAEYVNVNVHK